MMVNKTNNSAGVMFLKVQFFSNSRSFLQKGPLVQLISVVPKEVAKASVNFFPAVRCSSKTVIKHKSFKSTLFLPNYVVVSRCNAVGPITRLNHVQIMIFLTSFF